MKKILHLLPLLFIAYFSNAQVCIPNAVVGTGKGYILPDSATGLAHGCAGKPYEQTIYLKVFKDTTLNITGFPIALTGKVDSFIISVDDAAVGLPTYLNATSNPVGKPANALHNFKHIKVLGDSLACIKISGNIPANETPQSYNLKIGIKAYVDIYAGPAPLFLDSLITLDEESYKIIIDAPGTGACIPISLNNNFTNIAALQAVPNPASQILNIIASVVTNEKVTISVLDITGKQIIHQSANLKAGENYIPLNVSQLQSGMYTYMISNGVNKVGGKFIKE